MVGFLEIQPSQNFIKLSFSFSNSFSLSPLIIIFIFLLPAIFSLLIAYRRVGSQRGIVKIIGKNSLLEKILLEFNLANPDSKDISEENLSMIIYKMAEGEPEGTVENLQMLFRAALLVEEMIKVTGSVSVKNVYVSDDDLPNAFTIRVLPLPFIGSNWLIINRNLFEILNENETKAVIAHEIGHVKHYDSWVSTLLYSPRLINIIVAAIVLSQMASSILDIAIGLDTLVRIALMFGVFFIFSLLMNISLKLTSYSYRMAEYIADVYSVSICDSKDLINALYQIYRKGMILYVVQNELERFVKLNYIHAERIQLGIDRLVNPQEKSIIFALREIVKIFVKQSILAYHENMGIASSLINAETVNIVTESILKKRMEDLVLLGPDLPTDFEERVEFERRLSLSTENIDELITQIEKREKFKDQLREIGIMKDTPMYPPILERIQFVYNL